MKNMRSTRRFLSILTLLSAVFLLPEASPAQEFTDSFMIETCDFLPRGRNPYFILDPGYQLVLEGMDEGETVRLTITVLNETMIVNGIETRVVEERETVDGELAEVSRNYFAICKQNNSVFYFGEDVDIYDEGDIVSHEGAWLAGANGAQAGVIMPGIAFLGARYFQEIAPGVAMDRAEIQGLNEPLATPVGIFNCLKTRETSPLEPGLEDFKLYAPGIGLAKDGVLTLVAYSEPTSLEFDVDFSAATISSPASRQVRIGNVTVEFPDGNPIGAFFLDFDFNFSTLGFDLVGGGEENP